MSTLYFETKTNSKQLADELVRNTTERNALFELITAIDDRIAEYEFTEKLQHHFKEIIDKENEAIAKENKTGE